jgi:VanZ family protein
MKIVIAIARILGWLAVIVIGIVSVVPGDMRPHTGASGHLEHAIAYVIGTALMSFGYGGRHYPTGVALFLVLFAGFLETAQLLIPGRGGALSDFAASAGGVFVGSTLAWTVLRTLKRA